MGRSRTITNKQILEAAREVFLAEGFGASTIEIARRAGVSEGSIFKRFSTKDDLFFAAMGEANIPQWIRSLETLSGQGDVRENLVAISFRIGESLREVLPRLIVLHSKGILPPDRSNLSESPLAQILKALTLFFEEEIRLGRIRACNPEAPARILLGALTNQILMKCLLASVHDSAIEPASVEELIDLLWCGISPIVTEPQIVGE